ncbi:hypothetical protein DEIPH_ctg139orf0179 [Deinococcus phoenicis]|uniref:DUF305 domain-containing protein n=1 Tax=Deinococcus phoenicis TaxID=1476583 RepID=A0A016QKY7_9DEIO|nr:hypothetical protein DEIPH_ctg139orf0179 [Deinococcus phoenicis]
MSTAQAGGSGPMPMSAMPMTPMSMQMDVHARMQPVMNQLRSLSGTAFDRAFYSTMIPHHQSAIEMSRAALPRLRDPLVRAWAQSIIDSQQQEIAQMQAELQRLGGPNVALMNLMRQAMSGMTPMMTQMMARTQNPDAVFLEMMIPHHAGANEMSNLALERSNDEHVLSMAQQIILAQADEMHDFKDWLRTHP